MATGNAQHEKVQKMVVGSVIAGTFMPFLGAGASSLRPERATKPPWDQVSSRFTDLWASLAEDDPARRYLESQAIAHKIPFAKPREGSTAETDAQDSLFLLQRGLVRLGSYLVDVFGQEMSRSRRCVSELLEYEVDVPTGARRELVSLLLDVADAARALRDAEAAEEYRAGRISGRVPAPPKLGAGQIYARLLLFTCRMTSQIADECPDSSDEIHQRLKEHQPDLDDQQGRAGKTEAHLRLAELAWLEDLLWHTLRYRVPAIPTSGELSLHLSLTPDAQLVRRGDLSQVAELHHRHPETSMDSIRAWLRFWEDSDPSDRRFHLSMAAALLFMYRGYERAKSRRRRELPIAFTTNYDRAIENALNHLRTDGHVYHVVFPVEGTMGDPRVSGASQLWLLNTYTVTSPRAEPSRSGPFSCERWTLSEVEDNIRGPILVKLHGSPLEDLGGYRVQDITGGKPVQYTQLEHALILSESSYLAAIVGEMVGHHPFPTWLEGALKASGRELWFLGYSLSDWNVRLRLYEHLRYHREGDELPLANQQSPLKAIFDLRYEQPRSAILDTLQILQFVGELHEFGAHLRAISDVDEMVRKARP